MSEYLCKPESCDGTGDDPRCPHCVAFKSRVPAPSEDAVGVARVRVEGGAYDLHHSITRAEFDARVDALIAAVERRVRAECVREVAALREGMRLLNEEVDVVGNERDDLKAENAALRAEVREVEGWQSSCGFLAISPFCPLCGEPRATPPAAETGTP